MARIPSTRTMTRGRCVVLHHGSESVPNPAARTCGPARQCQHQVARDIAHPEAVEHAQIRRRRESAAESPLAAYLLNSANGQHLPRAMAFTWSTVPQSLCYTRQQLSTVRAKWRASDGNKREWRKPSTSTRRKRRSGTGQLQQGRWKESRGPTLRATPTRGKTLGRNVSGARRPN